MLDKNDFKDLMIYALVIGIFVLAAIVIKPVIFPIIYGVLLAYIFYPLYNFLYKRTKMKNLSALIICFGLLLFLIAIFWLFISTLLGQAVNAYLTFQKLDLTDAIRQNLPGFLSSSEFSQTFASSINTSLSKLISNFTGYITDSILNIPIILLKSFVVMFVFYFSLRDGEEAFKFISSFSPLKKETQEKFIKQLKNITYAVLMGQVIVGIIQGLTAGIGFFIFDVPNPLLLTLVAIGLSILPLGPWLVWIPVDIYLFTIGRSGAAVGLLIYGLVLVSWVDNIIRPLIITRKTKLNLAIVVIGMIGGVLAFGILGF